MDKQIGVFRVFSARRARLLSDINASDAVGRSIGTISRTVKQVRAKAATPTRSGRGAATDATSGDNLNLREFVEAVVRVAVVQVQPCKLQRPAAMQRPSVREDRYSMSLLRSASQKRRRLCRARHASYDVPCTNVPHASRYVRERRSYVPCVIPR
jgi:hypothetical protein